MTPERLTRDERAAAARVLIDSFRDYPYMRLVLRESGASYDADLEALVLFILDARWARRHPVLGLRGSSGLEAVGHRGRARPREAVAAGRAPIRGAARATRRRARGAHVGLRGGRPPGSTRGAVPLSGNARCRSRQTGSGARRQTARRGEEARDRPTTVRPAFCLNTETASNVALYEHLGFEVVGEADVEDLHTWCLFWTVPEAR